MSSWSQSYITVLGMNTSAGDSSLKIKRTNFLLSCPHINLLSIINYMYKLYAILTVEQVHTHKIWGGGSKSRKIFLKFMIRKMFLFLFSSRKKKIIRLYTFYSRFLYHQTNQNKNKTCDTMWQLLNILPINTYVQYLSTSQFVSFVQLG